VTAADVLEVLACLDEARIDIWLDGGWGVDALLAEETRQHGDLDLVVRHDDVPAAHAALATAGFAHAREEWPGLPARLVLRDAHGRQVDFHPVQIDERGDGWQDLGEGRFGRYPARGLRGRGMIEGRNVRCLTPELQLAHHCGYELPEHERLDVVLLVETFGLE
jgi:lincosamide nucleotidyltransferase A/C/D/E